MTDRIPLNEKRGLKHDEAAAYVGLSISGFDEEVVKGTYPKPVHPKRKPMVWDRVALDEAMDRLSSNKKMSLAEKVRARQSEASARH